MFNVPASNPGPVNVYLSSASLAKREKITGGWRKLHNEEVHNFFSSTDIIRLIKSKAKVCTTHRRDKKCI
jgi:hypothetical protein